MKTNKTLTLTVLPRALTILLDNISSKFGSWPSLFRLDFKYFLIQIIVHTVLFCVFPVLGNVVFGIAMAIMYNKLYTKDLLGKGFIFCDNPTLNEHAAVEVGCKPSGKNCDHLK